MAINVMDYKLLIFFNYFFFYLLILGVKKYSDACFIFCFIYLFIFSGQAKFQKLLLSEKKKTEAASYLNTTHFSRKQIAHFCLRGSIQRAGAARADGKVPSACMG